MYLLLMVLCVLLFCGQAAADEQPEAAGIPQSVIEEISDLAVPYGARIADSEKRRKYKAVLRTGRRIEADYPAATNRYLVWGKMLEAAQGLVMIDGGEENRKQLLELAARLSGAEAAAEARLPADVLLAHAEIAKAQEDRKQLGTAIAVFAEKYLNTDVEAQNLMQAMLMAWDANHRALFGAFRRRMTEDLWDVPGVSAFLRGRFAVKCREGHLFSARLTRPDGRVLRLPMDTLGHYVLVNFWSGSIEDIEYKLAPLKQFQREQSDKVAVLGVNLDRSRAEVERFVKRYGLDWTHTFSGMGVEDPTFLRYSMPHLPSYCLVGPRGRILAEDAHTLITGKNRRGGVTLKVDSRLRRKMVFLKSGEFLVTAPVGSTDPDNPPELGLGAARPQFGRKRIPRSVLDPIQKCFSTPPLRYSLREEESVTRYETALTLGEQAVKRHPKAGNLYLVRNRMIVAAQGLAALKLDDAFQRRAELIARDVLDGGGSPEAKFIADICATRAVLRGLDREQKIDNVLQAFLARYDRPGIEAVGLAAAALLALESGREKQHREWLSILQLRYEEDPRVRQMLMTFDVLRDIGRPFKARLTRLDGGTLKLPDDFQGKFGLVYFLDIPDGSEPRKMALEFLRGLKTYHENHTERLDVVGISLDKSEEELKELVKQEGWTWPIAFSGNGLEDPTAQTYGVHQPCRFPHVYIVGRDGLVCRNLPPHPDRTARSAVQHTTRPITDMLARIDRENGTAALAAGDFAEAERLLGRGIEAGMSQWWGHHVYRQRAQARAAQGKLSSALEDMDSAIKVAHAKKQNALRCDPFYEYRAELLEKMGRTEDAERDRQAAQQVRLEAEKQRDWLERHGGWKRKSAAFRGRAVPAWNIVGPFPLDTKALGRLGPYLRIVQPKDIPIPDFWHQRLPPEQKIDFDATYAGKAGASTAWRPVETDKNGLVDLSALYPEIDFAVACAAAYVFSEYDATYTVGVGCDDLMTVWVNGEKIHTSYGPGRASRGKKTLQVDFKPGWNKIVLKTANLTHEWGFYFDIVDIENTLRFALRPSEYP